MCSSLIHTCPSSAPTTNMEAKGASPAGKEAESNRIEANGYTERVNSNQDGRPAWSPAGATTAGWGDYLKVPARLPATGCTLFRMARPRDYPADFLVVSDVACSVQGTWD